MKLEVVSNNHCLLPDGFVPVVKHNVCYIVCAVVFNDQGEILMMQEAKASCRGMWYLPAGRMEPNETILVNTCIIITQLSLVSKCPPCLKSCFTVYISFGIRCNDNSYLLQSVITVEHSAA